MPLSIFKNTFQLSNFGFKLKTGLKEKFILGAMSGSSLDGLDLAIVKFSADFFTSNKWSFVKVTTIPYSDDWIRKLSNSINDPKLNELDEEFGNYLGLLIHSFLEDFAEKIDLIAVHGHTVFHEPDQAGSLQLGSSQTIANVTGIPTMGDFRNQDISLGGQGAPLAPTVEHWLFPEYKAFLNIGGIVNISYHTDSTVLGFDIGAGNQLLNYLANEKGFEYDEDGRIAALGKCHEPILEKCRENNFYQKPVPKSLSNQWVREDIIPNFKNDEIPLTDRMATAVDLIAWQLQQACLQISLNNQKILITGGGAFNKNLIKKLEQAVKTFDIQIELPSIELINFKEALLMSMMGFLNIAGKNNVLCSTTGSRLDHCAGNLFLPEIKTE